VPELPEVETVARQLAPRLVGRIVRRLQILDARLRAGRTPAVRGRRIEGVTRLGKQIVLRFGPSRSRTQGLHLAVHLRMTGRLVWLDGGEEPERERLRARFTLDRGRLLFLDTRRFGTFSWFRCASEAEPAGIDPLRDDFGPQRLSELIGSSRQLIKPWLLRQDRLVGLGNIYASEILHRSRISPLRPAGSLQPLEIRRLHASTRVILKRAIRNCGTTFSDFQDARGVEGSYQRYLAVYDREGDRCRRCRATLERIVQQQRSTFYCPSCQL
jgi:formamidopyrimidine-DNA glycosylase